MIFVNIFCVINGGLTLGLSSGWHNLNGKNVRPINLLQRVDMCQHVIGRW
jgi:hypothetical protein